MPALERPQPKKVVYLWGAGATHAEAQRLGSRTSLLMRDTDHFGPGITTRILQRIGGSATSAYGNGQGVDIEKLISLLILSGVRAHSRLAEEMRANYFAELISSLMAANILSEPVLATRLLKMHSDQAFQAQVETLSGVITTNHDGLLQIAFQEVYGGINLGFAFESVDFDQKDQAPPIIQLHGSFTWRFGVPVRVAKLRETSQYVNTIWIPPSILKESKNYPFSKLSGLAYELLAMQCDVLRVIGSSLTQNDWNILSLIFNAQRHRESTKREPFVIELIMPHSAGETIVRECGYLRSVIPIGYLSEGKFADYKAPDPIPPESDLANPFAYWLVEKARYHLLRHELAAPLALD